MGRVARTELHPGHLASGGLVIIVDLQPFNKGWHRHSERYATGYTIRSMMARRGLIMLDEVVSSHPIPLSWQQEGV